ncbi:UDP binding domain-containing protein, partial [Micrococcus sp. SIMBA_131]
ADWIVADPHVKSFKLSETVSETATLDVELLENADLVLLATDHSSFDYEMIASHSPVLFDTRNAFKNVTKPAKYYKL